MTHYDGYDVDEYFAVIGIDAGESINYRFLVEGTVSFITDGSAGEKLNTEGNDAIQTYDDDLVEVTGHTGNGYGDAYDVDGRVVMYERTGGDSAVLLQDGDTDVTDDVPRTLTPTDDDSPDMTDGIDISYTDGVYTLTIPEDYLGTIDPDDPSLSDEQKHALYSLSGVADRLKSAFGIGGDDTTQ